METKIEVLTKPLYKEPITPSTRVLGSLIELVYKEVEVINSYAELVELINSRFNVHVTEDQVINYFKGYIEEEDSRLIYEKYGHSNINYQEMP